MEGVSFHMFERNDEMFTSVSFISPNDPEATYEGINVILCSLQKSIDRSEIVSVTMPIFIL